MEELGGDPLAETKRIREAQRLFSYRMFSCNGGQFLSHINATAEQCNELDKVADDFGNNLGRLSPEEQLDYNNAVLAIMDQGQKRLVKQILFRQYWFSENCEAAFAVTNLELSEEDNAKVAALSQRLKQTKEDVQQAQHRALRGGPHVIRSIRGNKQNATLRSLGGRIPCCIIGNRRRG